MIKGNLLDLQTQRQVAKIGMTVSLGLVTLTAFNMKNKFSKNTHIISGVALIGFTLLHANLYNGSKYESFLRKTRNKIKTSKSKKQSSNDKSNSKLGS